METVARFLQRIYERGIPVKQRLSVAQAKTDAFSLLNKYQGLQGNGIAAAWIDVSLQYHGDVEPLLLQLKEIIKLHQRTRYVQWKKKAYCRPKPVP